MRGGVCWQDEQNPCRPVLRDSFKRQSQPVWACPPSLSALSWPVCIQLTAQGNSLRGYPPFRYVPLWSSNGRPRDSKPRAVLRQHAHLSPGPQYPDIKVSISLLSVPYLNYVYETIFSTLVYSSCRTFEASKPCHISTGLVIPRRVTFRAVSCPPLRHFLLGTKLPG
ncbi:hypothetical protein VTK26DRAFT_3639 [Humicola hyalothermophila]